MQTWTKKLGFLTCLLLLLFSPRASADVPSPLIFHASQSGKVTLDEGEGGGNPFASAFIEALRHRDLGCLTSRRACGI